MRKLRVFALVVVVFTVSSAFAQEMNQPTQEKVKGATCVVAAQREHGRSLSAGILFRKTKDSGYVITYEGRTRDALSFTVIFFSGTSLEKSYDAKVIASDGARNFACLLVEGAKDLPAPLEMGEKTAVKAKQPVYVAGIGVGASPDEKGKNPEIMVAKAAVRLVDAANRGIVSFDGEIKPITCTGPLVDSQGRLQGFANDFFAVRGSGVAFPIEQLRDFLTGRCLAPSFTPAFPDAGTAKVDIKLELMDPLGMLRDVGVAYVELNKVKAETLPPKDGVWNKIDSGMSTTSLTMKAHLATGAFEIKRTASEPREKIFLYQVFYKLADGKTRWMEPDSLEIYFPESAPGEAANAPDDGKGAAVEKPVELTLPEPLAVAASLKLDSLIRKLLLPADCSYLYALDLSEKKAYKIDPGTLKIVGEVDALDHVTTMALSPDGKSLYIGSAWPHYDSGHDKFAGAMQVVSTAKMDTVSTFDMQAGAGEIAATDGGILAVYAFHTSGEVSFFDASKKQLIIRSFCLNTYHTPYIQFHPDQTRLYCGERRDCSSASFLCVNYRKRDQKGECTCHAARYREEYQLGGDFGISPDGKYLVACTGVVLRLGPTRVADMEYAGKTEPCLAVAMNKGCNTVFTSSASGSMKAFSLTDFALKKAANYDKVCMRLAVNPARKLLYAVVVEPEADLTYANLEKLPHKVGNIVAFSLTE